MKEKIKGTIERISGSLVVAGGMAGASMQDVVHIGEMGLVGEILEVNGIKHLFKFMKKLQD